MTNKQFKGDFDLAGGEEPRMQVNRLKLGTTLWVWEGTAFRKLSWSVYFGNGAV